MPRRQVRRGDPGGPRSGTILEDKRPEVTAELSAALTNLAYTLIPAGHPVEASEPLHRNIELESATLGPDNPLVGVNLEDLALAEYSAENARALDFH
jgi:hypothetical protein